MGSMHKVLMKYEMVVLPLMLLSPFFWTTIFIWKNDRPTEQLWLFRLRYLAEIFLKMKKVRLSVQGTKLTVFAARDKI